MANVCKETRTRDNVIVTVTPLTAILLVVAWSVLITSIMIYFLNEHRASNSFSLGRLTTLVLLRLYGFTYGDLVEYEVCVYRTASTIQWVTDANSVHLVSMETQLKAAHMTVSLVPVL